MQGGFQQDGSVGEGVRRACEVGKSSSGESFTNIIVTHRWQRIVTGNCHTRHPARSSCQNSVGQTGGVVWERAGEGGRIL